MVWAGIGTHHRTDLVTFKGRLNAQAYMDTILHNHAVPFCERHRETEIFQHDNAWSHAALVTTRQSLQNKRIPAD